MLAAGSCVPLQRPMPHASPALHVAPTATGRWQMTSALLTRQRMSTPSWVRLAVAAGRGCCWQWRWLLVLQLLVPGCCRAICHWLRLLLPAATDARAAGILANFGLIAAGSFTRYVNEVLAKSNEVLSVQVGARRARQDAPFWGDPCLIGASIWCCSLVCHAGALEGCRQPKFPGKAWQVLPRLLSLLLLLIPAPYCSCCCCRSWSAPSW